MFNNIKRRRIRRRSRNRKPLPRLPTSLSNASTTSRTWTPSTSRWHTRIHRQSDSTRNFILPMSTEIIKSIRYEILLNLSLPGDRELIIWLIILANTIRHGITKNAVQIFTKKLGMCMRMRIHRDKIGDTHETERNTFMDLHTYTCSHDHTWTCAHIHVRTTIHGPAHIYVFAWPYTCNISKRIRGCTYNVTNHNWRTAACEGVLLPPR